MANRNKPFGKNEKVRVIVTIREGTCRVFANCSNQEIYVSVLDYDSLDGSRADSPEHEMYIALEKEVADKSKMQNVS